ncbi:hypothetical protein L9F63_006185 [Diploptera punctata]|uniref:G-protein coupled receptors family 1 profile domain-containing protein n=1 Tax=Diploptera punctata TaxID=6984 RepID=A0AAD8E559_DIPPU|nr:hypothetical protein L9F63_006185 [Diploptera punctata]
MTALAIAFALTHVPRSLWFFIRSYFELDSKPSEILDCVDEITNYLMFFHSIVNPIALYIASATFRNLFNQYLFRFHSNKVKHKELDNTKSTQGNK